MSPAAIATVVTIAEILKNNGFAVEKSQFFFFASFRFLFKTVVNPDTGSFVCLIEITTSTVDINESGGRPVQKAKVFSQEFWHFSYLVSFDLSLIDFVL